MFPALGQPPPVSPHEKGSGDPPGAQHLHGAAAEPLAAFWSGNINLSMLQISFFFSFPFWVKKMDFFFFLFNSLQCHCYKEMLLVQHGPPCCPAKRKPAAFPCVAFAHFYFPCCLVHSVRFAVPHAVGVPWVLPRMGRNKDHQGEEVECTGCITHVGASGDRDTDQVHPCVDGGIHQDSKLAPKICSWW